MVPVALFYAACITAAVFAAERALFGRFFLVRLGKKKYHLFELA